MKKIIVALLLTLIASTGFAAEQKLTVALDTMLNAVHAPLIVAQQEGFFRNQGLEVELINPTPAANAAKLVSTGKADIGITYQPDFIHQLEKSKSLTRIGSLIDRPLECVVTLKDSNIKTLADLKGKRIGTNKHDLSGLMLKAMLKNAGLSEKDYSVVTVHHSLNQALLSHQVDAVIGLSRNADVPQLERQGHKVNVFFPEENGIPNYSVLIFMTKTANAQDPRVPHFLDALREAVYYLDEHSEHAWRAYTKANPRANNKLNHDMWFATLPYYAEDPAAFDRDEWQHFADYINKNKLINSHYALAQKS